MNPPYPLAFHNFSYAAYLAGINYCNSSTTPATAYVLPIAGAEAAGVGSEYRYGYQGQEGDDELYGDGGAYSFKYRVNDTRLGRFLSIDPLEKEYPWNSPYAFSENRVTNAIELEGLEAIDLYGQNYHETYKLAESRGEDGVQTVKDLTKIEGRNALLTINFFAIAVTMVISPAIGIPWAVSEILGIPAAIPAPQAYATTVARPVVSVAEEIATTEAAASTTVRPATIAPKLATTTTATATTKVSGTAQAAIEAGIHNIIKPTGSGGRLGNAATRRQIEDIATTLESRDYTITWGGGRFSEEYLKPLGGGRSGGSYLDLTATHPNYGTLRINTVDVYKNGLPTRRVLNNAERIRTQIAPSEHLLLIPKNN